MIVKKVSSLLLPAYTLSEAMNIGIKKLLLTSMFGKVFILSENRMLLGYYSARHYKDAGSLDMQYDTVYLQEDEVDAEQNDISIPLSAEGTDHGILPIVSASGRVTDAVICTDEAWHNDKVDCLAKLEYLSEKKLSLEYWFLAKNYRKIAFWGLDVLSLAFANEIRHYPGIEVLGIYEKQDLKAHKKIDYLNYDTDVNFVGSIEDVAALGAELVIVTDWAMRFLEDFPLTANTDVIYAKKILNLNTPLELYDAQKTNKELINNDVSRYTNAEICDRYKAKYRALGCSFLTAAIPNCDDLNISKDYGLSREDISKWVAERNGWESEGEENEEFMSSYYSAQKNSIKTGGKIYYGDFKSRYINYINKSRVVLNVPSAYKNTVYLVGPCIVGSTFCEDKQTLGYYLQENMINCGLEYRVVSVHMPGDADIYYKMNIIEEFDVKQGDIIFYIDSKYTLLEWDLELTPAFKELYGKYGDAFFIDQPIHCGKEGNKAVADFLTEHIGDTFVSDAAPRTAAQTHVRSPKFTGNPQLKKYQEFLQNNAVRIGSIVMNCNPFTLGHLHLIEHAAEQVDHLYIFVVEEDRSLFKFEDRMELVKAGTSHLKNVKVLPSGQFIISALTFSEYFDKANLEGTTVDTSLDVETFGSQIAPCLNISVRFVGEEPFDPVTAQYNHSMKEILPKYGVELREIPRKEVDGEAISASRVRKCLEEKNWDEIRKLVPETTYSFLKGKF